MDNLLEKSIERNKNFLIDQLISGGVYKINNTHLFELSLTDLEKEFHKIQFTIET